MAITRRKRQVLVSAGNAVLAAALAVLVNVWTSGWPWPAGIGVGVLLAGQILVLWWTSGPVKPEPSAEDSPVLPEAARTPPREDHVDVDMDLGDVTDADVHGVRVNPGDTRSAKVKQKADKVDRSTMIGYDATGSRPPRPDS